MSKPRILFVDDEPSILDGLRRMLRRKGRAWDMDFASGGHDALRMMQLAPYDVIVSDMRMPHMDGAELLSHVMEEYPETIRFILSGHSDKNAILRSLPATHQYMSKPCEASTLVEQLHRAICLKDQLDNELVKRMVLEIDSLPTLPNVYEKIVQISDSDVAGAEEASAIISHDIGMSAKILQLVNSSFFCVAQEISDIKHAISLLGMETLKSLVLSIGMHEKFVLGDSFSNFSLDKFTRHCNDCAQLAKKIVLKETANEAMAEHAFTAGLLHDVGKLIMASKLPDIFRETLEIVHKENLTVEEVELECEGISHAAVGAYLLGLWRLPLPVLDAVAFHHAPEKSFSQIVNPTIAVYAANIIVQEMAPGSSGNMNLPKMDMDFMRRMGLENKVDSWRCLDISPATRMEHLENAS